MHCICCAQVLEKRADEFWSTGRVAEWHEGSDPRVRGVAGAVNGPLLEVLAAEAKHCDPGCVQLFRTGAPILGTLDCSGVGVATPCVEPVCLDEMAANCTAHNEELLRRLHEDPLEAEQLQCIMDDVFYARMSMPVPVGQIDAERVRMHPRFAVDQGIK